MYKSKYNTGDLKRMEAPTDKIRTVQMEARIVPIRIYTEYEKARKFSNREQELKMLTWEPIVICAGIMLLWLLVLIYVIVMVGSRLAQ